MDRIMLIMTLIATAGFAWKLYTLKMLYGWLAAKQVPVEKNRIEGRDRQ